MYAIKAATSDWKQLNDHEFYEFDGDEMKPQLLHSPIQANKRV